MMAMTIRCRRSCCPGQHSFALALENDNHDDQGERGNCRGDDSRDCQSEGGKKHAGDGSCRGPADGFPEAHESIETTLLPDWREIDRHAVDRDVLGRCETVDERAD
jgi:hypothetical protein